MFFNIGVLMASGDSIAQLAVERRGLSGYDVVRSGRFFIFGVVGAVCIYPKRHHITESFHAMVYL